MKAASVNELKQELQNVSTAKLLELCLRLAKFKKENKELLTYLLFEQDDIDTYINNVKTEIDTYFNTMNKSNVFFVKKTLRKILRIVNKYIRYSALPNVEIELLLHFCSKIKTANIYFRSNTVLINIYNNQLKKIRQSIAALHEDLQYDYLKEIKHL